MSAAHEGRNETWGEAANEAAASSAQPPEALASTLALTIANANANANANVADQAAQTATAPSTTASIAVPSRPIPDAPGGTGAVGGAVFALLLVVALILALGWLAKRMPGVAGSSNAALRVVGSLSLGARERVVVVAVGDTQLLLGVGPGGTRTLHTLATPLPVAVAASSPFAQLLAQQFGRKA